MAYADYVLSKGPVAYFTLSNSTGAVDITGNGNTITGYTAGTDSPIVPGYLCGSLTGPTGVSNSLGVLTEPGQQNKYTIELWARLKVSAFSGTYSTAYDIVSTATGNSKIYIENSLVTFMLTDDSDNVYRATARHTDFDESMHIAAVYSPDGFFIAVNGVAGDIVTFPKTSKIKDGASTLRLSSTNMFVSNLAIYQKTLSISEIQQNYNAGRSKLDKASMAVAQGASFYSLSKDRSDVMYSNRFDIEDFPYGNIRNLVIDDDTLKIVQYPSALVRDADLVSYTPTYSSGILLGGTSSTKHLMVPGIPGLNSNGGFVGLRLTTSSSNREILSISSKRSRKSLTWSLNATGGTGALSLVSRSYDVSGDLQGTPTTYTYGATFSSGTTDIWFLMDSSGVRVSAPSLVSDTFNQVSSADYVYETILIDDSTEIILGADDSYASASTATRPFLGLWIGSDIPSSIVYSDLKGTSLNSSSYDWSSFADTTAKTRGEWTYTFSVSTDGAYSGSYLDFDLSPDSKSKVQIKYNTDVSYTECRRGEFLPSMAYSGTYPTVAQGPITLQVVLESENIVKNVPEISSLEFFVYADNTLSGNTQLGDATLSGSSISTRPLAFIPGESRKRLNCTFSGTGNIVIPGATAGAHRSIEMTFIVEGTRSTTGVLASVTGNQINISPSNVVTATGSSWPTGSIYLNGIALSAGSATAKSDSVNHLLIVGSTGSTGSLYINSKNDNSLYVSGTSQFSSYGYLATWPIALTSDQITDVLASRNGIVISQPTMTADSIALVESTTANRVNITPWQTVLS